jgi:hypothetical protein
MTSRRYWLTVFAGIPLWAFGADEHRTIYAERGRYGGWPANHGVWHWGDEILVGFSAGYVKSQGPDRHAIDYERPEEYLMARSKDGGRNWVVENPAAKGFLIGDPSTHHLGRQSFRKGLMPPDLQEETPLNCPGGIDFTHPDFAMTIRMTGLHDGPSYFHVSKDRGHTWTAPFRLPMFGRAGIAGRTDYIVNGKHNCLIFLTAAKENGREGRVMCARTVDGGKSWKFVSWIGPEPKGFAIMPSTVSLSGSRLVTAFRRSETTDDNIIDAYSSDDNGQTWKLLNHPVESTGGHHGSPPSLIRLRDGRLCLTYGHRSAPFGVRARFSSDDGRSWGKEIVLRDDGASWDVGYPVSVQRPDGKIVTVYYIHDKGGLERHIAATIWAAGERTTEHP